jgi:hypothetical protein
VQQHNAVVHQWSLLVDCSSRREVQYHILGSHPRTHRTPSCTALSRCHTPALPAGNMNTTTHTRTATHTLLTHSLRLTTYTSTRWTHNVSSSSNSHTHSNSYTHSYTHTLTQTHHLSSYDRWTHNLSSSSNSRTHSNSPLILLRQVDLPPVVGLWLV